uniref:Retrotransposon gag domain-containing protein n=1 Tax=Moniliophthora roreri TaxID=221103 RepID=A0A0W0FBT2_MONRR
MSPQFQPQPTTPIAPDIPGFTGFWVDWIARTRGLQVSLSRPPSQILSTIPLPTKTPDTQPKAPETPNKAAPCIPMANTNLEYTGEFDDLLDLKNFLCKAEGEMALCQYEEAKYTDKIHLFLKVGSTVDIWYEELEDEVKKGGWNKFKTRFLQDFKSAAVATPSASEKRRELLELTISVDELGKRHEASWKWTHICFARQLLDVAKAAGIANMSSDIVGVYEKLPCIIKSKVSDNAKDWTEFTKSISDISKKYIKEEKAVEDRIQAIEKHIETLSKRLGRSLAATSINPTAPNMGRQGTTRTLHKSNDSTVFSSTGGGQGNLNYNHPRQPPILNDAQKTTLHASIAAYKQHPSTQEGVAAYLNNMSAFRMKWGNTHFNKNMIFPYAPGTLPPGLGECFTCGHKSHGPGMMCTLTSRIGTKERAWRAFVQRELGVNRLGAVSVNAVGVEGGQRLKGFMLGLRKEEGSTD